jgi:hypothetical protein
VLVKVAEAVHSNECVSLCDVDVESAVLAELVTDAVALTSRETVSVDDDVADNDTVTDAVDDFETLSDGENVRDVERERVADGVGGSVSVKDVVDRLCVGDNDTVTLRELEGLNERVAKTVPLAVAFGVELIDDETRNDAVAVAEADDEVVAVGVTLADRDGVLITDAVAVAGIERDDEGEALEDDEPNDVGVAEAEALRLVLPLGVTDLVAVDVMDPDLLAVADNVIDLLIVADAVAAWVIVRDGDLDAERLNDVDDVFDVVSDRV